MANTLRAGDIVRLKDLPREVFCDEELFPDNPDFTGDMMPFIGRNLTIASTGLWSSKCKYYTMKEDKGRFCWDTRWFISVPKEPITYLEFIDGVESR